ncbi:unnamed protein product [Prorocentrum cordatum]|uniref:Helicase ATP-binding domain-containing protein n=1 Tax=Prorocentrum cordatum TaxID=2364126 RepID=A0ABN9PAY6_9DINO|nr:unnamed protein product [Polarella glacialis]
MAAPPAEPPGAEQAQENGRGDAAAADEDPCKALPIYPHREAILEHVRQHRVTHIQGETGCGKSTQVPKYIMEEAESLRKAGKSDCDTKIVVTQPRRMAAISLAKRCAQEVGEEVGKTVGYKISGDSVSGKLCFATTGFLLQVLVNQPEEFGTYSHIILLHEVHERSVDADLLTMLLKLLMQCYPHVKLIVMSATLQAHLFAEYFKKVELTYMGKKFDGPIPEVKPLFVGVRTFPVEQVYLDDLDANYRIEGGQARRALEGAIRAMDKGGGKGGKGGKDKGKGKGKKGDNSGTIAGSASGFKRAEPAIVEGCDMLCKELVQQMAREKCTLIVFLPGIADITSFYEALAPLDGSRTRGGDSGGGFVRQKSWDTLPDGSPKVPSKQQAVTLRIFPMHSLIPREEQEEVFNAPPKGVCHIVLASNIAESSLTLPSVCAVIDMCLRRSIEYDARRLMSCLVTTWCSQSSCKQRSGRAGRTMPGTAVRMVTRNFFETMRPWRCSRPGTTSRRLSAWTSPCPVP